MESKTLHDRGKRFLEAARTDPWHANVVLQLAESVGDSIDSLSGYLDMQLAVIEAHEACEAAPGTEKAKYRGWLGEIGEIDRWTRLRRVSPGELGRGSRSDRIEQ
jgi:hypothetical protein